MSKFVECSFERHGDEIREILNHCIKNTTVLYDYQPRTEENVLEWFDTKKANGFPVVGLENDEDELVGFATFGKFRPQAAYLHTVEHSIYVHHESRGKGFGKKLLREIIERAKSQDFHSMVGMIDKSNHPSITLHKAFGFKHCGSLPDVGWKFDRWLSVEIYSLILEK